jgi:predicted site-specific integrase-resolvase
VTSILQNGDRLRMSGLGIIEVKDRPARMRRNPATGAAVQIAASEIGMKLSYARVSTEDQHLYLQRTRLKEGGCGKLFEEKISGAARQRPALERLLQDLRADDILVVTRLDRLARSTAELLRIPRSLLKKTQDYCRLRSLGPIPPRRRGAWC